MNIIESKQLISTKFYDNTITIDTTHNCNYNCWYCYDKHNKNNGEFLELSVLEKFFEIYTKTLPINKINVNLLGGEPTLHPKLKQLILLCESVYNVKNIRLTTNGWKDAQYYIELMKDTCKTHIGFSYHENNYKTFEQYIEMFDVLKNNTIKVYVNYMITGNEDYSIIESRKRILEKYYYVMTPISQNAYEISNGKVLDNSTNNNNTFRLLKIKYDDGTSIISDAYKFTKGTNPFKGMKCDAFNEYWRMDAKGNIRFGCEPEYSAITIAEFEKFIESIKDKICTNDICHCFFHSRKYR